MTPPVFTSVSTWFQPEPQPVSAQRSQLVQSIAARINAPGGHRLRVAVDGFTAAGKTSFGHELASALHGLGRPVLRASLDDFKNPWKESHLYDRLSGEGYYRNAFDFNSTIRLLLEPAGPAGSGTVTLCSIDPITQADHRDVTVQAPDNAVLVADGVFAFRPQYNSYWDFRIWLDVDPDHSITRGTERDTNRDGREEAERLHRDRYGPAEQLYIAEVDPRSLADLVIDNRDFAAPVLLRG